MKKLFPSMTSRPEKIQIFALIPSWIWVFVLLPMFIPFIGLGLWDQNEYSVWLEIGYHVANGLLMLWVMLGYLKDEWWMVTTNVRYYLKHVALTAALAVGVEAALLGTLYLCGIEGVYLMLDSLPVVEMSASQTPMLLVKTEPVFGTLTLLVFTPLSICALFYCFGFAPVCCKKPWLGYLSIAVITLIPPVINILWRGDAALFLSAYLVQLPIHLLMCWSYQKTDNVWTPLMSLAAVNLLASVVVQNILL